MKGLRMWTAYKGAQHAYRFVDCRHLVSSEHGIPNGQLSQGACVAPLRCVVGAPAQRHLAVNHHGLAAIHISLHAIAACGVHAALWGTLLSSLPGSCCNHISWVVTVPGLDAADYKLTAWHAPISLRLQACTHSMC